MKKIILISIMAFTFLYVGLIDFSYAKGFAKGTSELRGEERKIEQDADDSYEKDREDDVVEDDDDDEVKVEADDDDDDDDDEGL